MSANLQIVFFLPPRNNIFLLFLHDFSLSLFILLSLATSLSIHSTLSYNNVKLNFQDAVICKGILRITSQSA